MVGHRPAFLHSPGLWSLAESPHTVSRCHTEQYRLPTPADHCTHLKHLLMTVPDRPALIPIVEKSAARTLELTPYVDPYPLYFLCRYLHTNTNMGDQLSIRELKSLFTTQLDTTREDTYTFYVAILPWYHYTIWQLCHLLLETSYAIVCQGGRGHSNL